MHNHIKAFFYFSRKNLWARLKGRRVKIWFSDEDKIFSADDGRATVYFSRIKRGGLYHRGINRRFENLLKDYHLAKIDISATDGGVLIDCGANIGELGFWARKSGLSYVAFEPEALEARCCDLNNYGGERKTHRKALWKETTKLTFHSKPDSADGSVIPIGNETSRFEVDAVTLDDAVDLSGISGTVILKVEAEGAEPEVLEGAQKTLSRADWVTVDCGHERGVERAHTFVEVNNILTKQGFAMRHCKFQRVTALYQNTKRFSDVKA